MEKNNVIFKENVYTIVSSIPVGKVLTYGHIAVLCGRPHNARMVGNFLRGCPEGVPAHRVVNHKGRTAPGWAEQVKLLQDEGVFIKENGFVDMKNHLWKDY